MNQEPTSAPPAPPTPPEIKLSPVQSSQLDSVGHDPETNTLAIKFKSGGVYHYSNFDKDQFAEFVNSPSVGSHFYKHIKPHKDKHPYTKIG